MSKGSKYYVVWAGHDTGVFDSWEEAQQQVNGYAGARFRGFNSRHDAIEAYRNDGDEASVIKKIFTARPVPINYAAFPEIRLDAIAVDGACAKNPGPMEYRGVRVGDRQQLFHLGPLEDGTNNIGEYLALVHALALLAKMGDSITPIYTDSRTALSWLRRRGHKSSLARTPRNARIFELLDRADSWVQTHTWSNPVLKWNTEEWGEIPADFGRK